MAKRNRQPLPLLENIEIKDAGSEGKAVARVDNMVIFVPFVVPGDVIDIQVIKRKRNYMEGKAVNMRKPSPLRIEPRCEHFGVCGGCRWQNLPYNQQLHYKQQQVKDNFERIGKLSTETMKPILGSEKTYEYRNKLEFTFSNRRWLSQAELQQEEDVNMDGLGFHLPGMFDRIIDLQHCYLQPAPSNEIREALRQYTAEHKLEYYDNRKHQGLMRNLIIRTANSGDVMVIVVFARDEFDKIHPLMDFLRERFPQITSLFYVVNSKLNDTINDQEMMLWAGEPYIMEHMEDLLFKVGPQSFYQTNAAQAYQLYKVARSFAALTGTEAVYDLYCGAGTISNFVAHQAAQVVGVEYVESAIDDARENSKINNITNTHFVAGDMAKVFDESLISRYGKPDVVITDPPRAGMHPKVVERLLELQPQRIVYVSCNPATQARDIALLGADYEIAAIQPVDMFPQTQHVENVALLIRRQATKA
ncbi:MAG: 23S rRNA (uracil(1939)-C(5))-methyltransferase RlmD [Clostridia bacterium]|nr:23S rRNA (uracil(1939)-C(5))-methyltransferase RlmD [Clostridia bacterium]